VNEFVEQCRREWRRLHVPDADADEMAAELAADLEQAEAEGVSAEEVLGAAAADARSFAAAWAGERGVTPWHVRRGKRALPVAALAALAAIAIAGAVLVAVASPSTPRTQVTLGTRSDLAAGRVMQAAPPPAGVWVTQQTGRVLTIEVPSAVVVQRDSGGSDDDMRTIGLVLLIVGLAGIVPLAALALLRS
jgi:hypothetical protein